MKIIVTTSYKKQGMSAPAREFAEDGGFIFVKREDRSLESLMEEYKAEAVLVWHQQGPILHLGKEKWFFHPGMAYNRLTAFRKTGQTDLMAKACCFQDGDVFLDCTLGLGADAIVASYFLPNGKICGLETSPAIAQVVKWGMKMYTSRQDWLNEAMRRITVIRDNHCDYLRRMPDASADIVYFDPMFRKPLWDSKNMLLLRSVADDGPVSAETIAEALRVARKKVVFKERNGSGEFDRLGFTHLQGSKNNPVAYGIMVL
ncbi:MAG: class I SAM-dependent methyltransferase [Syntrophomonadaceae bacterium]|jgi:hypothetical protein|nr:class I SAM-dependent methyltransferase [Syntrophomonadaceae bacterium]